MAPGDFLAQVRSIMRLRQLSSCTEQRYCSTIKQCICYHDKRHPAEMGAEAVTAFLPHRARDRHVRIATQHVARCARRFLYRVVLDKPLPQTRNLLRPHRQKRLPVVFTRSEVSALLAQREHPSLRMGLLRAFLSFTTRTRNFTKFMSDERKLST